MGVPGKLRRIAARAGKYAALALLIAALAVARHALAQDDPNVEPPIEAQPVHEDAPPQPAEPMPAPEPEPQPEPAAQPEYTAPQQQPAPEEQMDNPTPPPPIMPTVRPSRPGLPAAGNRPMPSSLPPRPRPTRPGMPGAPAAPGARPSLPGAAGTPNTHAAAVDNSEKKGEKASEPINFDYRDAPLNEVIESIAKLTGRNFDVDPNIGAVTVTVITHDKIPPEMAYQVLESILSSRGFAMVPSVGGNLIKILPIQEAPSRPSNPTLMNSKSVAKETYDQFSTHVVQVKHADPTELANALKILGSANAKIDVYVPTNTLIITDIADGLKRMFEFMEQADVPGQETSMEIFQLTYTRAEVISDQINQVLLDNGNGAKGQQRPGAGAAPQPVPQRAPVRGRPNVPGQSASQVIGSNEEVLRMVSDERLNSLIVVATAGMMEKVRDLVERLDTPTPYEANTLHIYELLNAEAEQVDQALQGLVGGGGGYSGSRSSTSSRRSTGSSFGRNSRNSQTQRRNQTQNQQRPGTTGATGGPSGAAADVQPFEQSVQITRYDQTNSLLIVCSPQDWKLLESVIAQLDVRQRQVHVDAVVMDVTMNDNYSVEVDASNLKTGYFAQLGTQQISKLASGLAGAAGAASTVASGTTGATATSISPQAALDAQILGLGTNGGLSTGVFKDLEFTVSGKKVKIPFVPLLFQAIESITDLEVLSQPSLVTVDNEEASITVGQEIPYVTSQGRTSLDANGNPQSNSFYGGFNQVQREDVGVKLRVTPQISEGESILLELELEISDTDANQIGDVNLLGPTLNKSLVSNKVLVKDGSTAVLAGLIRDTNTRKRAQPPVLGDVPVVGWLFRSKSNTRTKRNMVVLVTPTIIKEGQDHERVTQYKVDEFRDTNFEELWHNKSFFKKVKQKANLRKNNRPTVDKSEELVGERNSEKLSKGDIER